MHRYLRIRNGGAEADKVEEDVEKVWIYFKKFRVLQDVLQVHFAGSSVKRFRLRRRGLPPNLQSLNLLSEEGVYHTPYK